jgi:hypothetical protein
MGLLKLSQGFTSLPDGEQTLYITGVDYDEKWGKIEVHCINASGIKHSERYRVLNDKGETNEVALNLFSWLARAVLGEEAGDEIDPTTLKGCYFKCNVSHVKSEGKDGKVYTNTRLGDLEGATGFVEPVSEKAKKIIGESSSASNVADKRQESTSDDDELLSALGL